MYSQLRRMRMRSKTRTLWILVGVITFLFVSCGGSDKFEVESVTLCHGLTSEMEAKDPGDTFKPDEKIYVALKLNGRPKEGVVTAKFYFGEQFIDEASYDLADLNSGVIFSVGESTNVGFHLAPAEPFPVSDDYFVELYHGDEKIGTYEFSVVAD
jgi:hypothetical protein